MMRTLIIAATALFATVSTAQAESLPPVEDETAKAECSDCHMAYPAIVLPQASWKKIIGNLSDHYGEDASLDAATTQHVLNYYVNNSNDVLQAKHEKAYEKTKAEAAKAGKNVKFVRAPGILRTAKKWASDGAPDRIQDVRRFKSKHSFSQSCKPIIKGVMARAKVMTMAMCSGCHAGMPIDGSSNVRFKNDVTLSAKEAKCLDD